LPGASELVERTEAALSRPPGRSAIPANEIDEIRIVASWIAEHEPPTLRLDPAPDPDALAAFAAEATPAGAPAGAAVSAA
jgi:hypothetical protein